MVDGWSSRRSNRTTPRNDQGGGRTPTGYMGGSGSSHSTPQGTLILRNFYYLHI